MTTTTKYLSVRPVCHFLRHLGEMILAMIAGMVAGGTVLALIFSTSLAATIRGMARVEVLNQFAVLICLVVGGIARKPAVVEGRIEPREILNLTVAFDHDVVDGAVCAAATRVD